METYALVGPSGTGKSHKALLVAHRIGAQAIIDDGLLIVDHQIRAGSSAKRQNTRIGAIKASLFMDDKNAREMKASIKDINPTKILVMATSAKMAVRIAQRLELPPLKRIIDITEIASEKEIRIAKYMRNQFNKHVIPAPTLEVKRSLPGMFVDAMHILIGEKETPGKKKWKEQSIVRPAFSYIGKITIRESAIIAIVDHAARSVSGIISPGKISVKSEQSGIISLDISPTMAYGLPLHQKAYELQEKIIVIVENMTWLQVRQANVTVNKVGYIGNADSQKKHSQINSRSTIMP